MSHRSERLIGTGHSLRPLSTTTLPPPQKEKPPRAILPGAALLFRLPAYATIISDDHIYHLARHDNNLTHGLAVNILGGLL